MSVDADRFRAFERAAHDRLAENYHDFFTPITALAVDALLGAVDLRPGARVLDIASGPGSVAAAAATRSAQVVGTDLAPGMVELARRLHPAIVFHEADVEALPFPDGAFDAVVCNFGLGHFPRPEASLAECVRVLAPGGTVALSWWDDPQRQRVQGLFRDAIAEVGATPPPDVPQGHPLFRFSNSGEFHRLLDGAGLVGVAIREHRTSYRLPDTGALWKGGLGSLAVTGATIASQPEDVQRQIRAAFERWAAVYRTENGLEVPIAFKIGTAHKRK
jgi:SAM-dependent methyltransferase